MRVLILNGPPGIGKDTLAINIERNLGFPIAMFKDALYRETATYFGIDLLKFIDLANDREFKEQSLPVLDGFSPRGALIHVSESIIKPLQGKKFFGLKAVEMLKTLDGTTGTVVFSDGGFPQECECLVEHGYEVHIIQLHHKDFNFSKDSRNYVAVPGATVHTINVVMGQPMADLNNFYNILESLDQ